VPIIIFTFHKKKDSEVIWYNCGKIVGILKNQFVNKPPNFTL